MESKETARGINNFNRRAWNDVAEELCHEGIKQKFMQNQHLLEELLKTGDKTLVESSYDDVWGTGIPHLTGTALLRNNGSQEEYLVESL